MSRVKDGRCCIHAPADDYYRKRYETLARTGAMPTGKDIPAHDRFLALPISQIRSAADSLGLPRKRGKQAFADAMRELPKPGRARLCAIVRRRKNGNAGAWPGS